MTFSTKFENYFHVFRDIIRAMHSSTSVKEVLEEVVAKSTEVLSAKGALLRHLVIILGLSGFPNTNLTNKYY